MASWSSEGGRFRHFTLAEIKKATESFNDKNIVGKGGEGTVYEGVFADARKSTIRRAVKRLNRSSPGERALKSFEKEINLISKFHHANLVSLIGYCQESEEKILVYELMSKENLRHKLGNKAFPLSYEQRLIICIGAARAIDYLHSGTSLNSNIIHGDIKPENILLTEKMEAKVSDFGLSRIVAANQTHSSVITHHLCGTRGYFAPECITGKLTWRIDVYAFGVVLTEVLCKKKPTLFRDDSDSNHKNDENFSKWALRNIDPALKRAISESSLEAFISTAEKCLNEDPYNRPRMNEVVGMLDSALKLQKNSEVGNCIKSKVNGEKRQMDSESSSSSSSKSSNGFGTSKLAKFENISSDLFSESSTSSGMSGSTWKEIGAESSTSSGMSGSTWKESGAERSGELISSSQVSRVYKSCGKSEEDAKYSFPSTKIEKNFKVAGEEMMSKKGHSSSKSSPSAVLPDIPGTQDKVVLYYGNSIGVTDYMMARLYLNSYKARYEVIDTTESENEDFETKLRQFLSEKHKEFSLPQLFIGGKYIGGAKEIVQLYDSGQLGQYLAMYQH